MNEVSISLNSVVVQAENLVSSELDGETILMGVNQAAYFGLDATSQRIWDLIAQPKKVSEVCDQLVAEYDVDRATCEQQVFSFLTELNKESLIRVVVEDGS
jgi:hypothetical protein